MKEVQTNEGVFFAEEMIGLDGKPKVWMNGSPVVRAFDSTGATDLRVTAALNPWVMEWCEQRGYDVASAIEKKLGELRCYHCGVLPGEFHERDCVEEVCPNCGDQLISCSCDRDWEEGIRWAGMSHGFREALEYDFWCHWRLLPPIEKTNYQTSGWVRCSKDEHGARLDLNRVHEECTWEKVKRRWVRPSVSP